MDNSGESTVDRREMLAWAAGAVVATVAASGSAAASDASNAPLGGVRLKRIDNMDIYTRNLPRLVDFYTATLGLKFFLPYEPTKGWAAIDFGNLTLYMFEANLGEHAPPRPGDRRVPGIDAFAFEVDDVDKAVQALEGKVTWCQPAIELWSHPSGTHYRYRAFYDPDGNKLYVTQPHKVPQKRAGAGAA
jgi:catechol 2,3-dioxygenase-like lactoylglutathione lyase family enzyme